MASVISITGPAVTAPGSSFQLAIGLSNPDSTRTITGLDENGVSVTCSIDIHENVVLSTNPADIIPAANGQPAKAKPGTIVITSSDANDVLTVDAANPLTTVNVALSLT